jgi:hypothetical protein
LLLVLVLVFVDVELSENVLVLFESSVLVDVELSVKDLLLVELSVELSCLTLEYSFAAAPPD